MLMSECLINPYMILLMYHPSQWPTNDMRINVTEHRAYGQGIQEVEHASFTPIMLFAIQQVAWYGFFYKHLVGEYSKVLCNTLSPRLSFIYSLADARRSTFQFPVSTIFCWLFDLKIIG